MTATTHKILVDTLAGLHGFAQQPKHSSVRNGARNAATHRLETLEMGPDALAAAMDAAANLLAVLRDAKATAEDAE
jgi:hypothetical protein